MNDKKDKIAYTINHYGFVVQGYNQDGKCVDQEFHHESSTYSTECGDEFDPDDTDDEIVKEIGVDFDKAEEFPVLMVQPCFEYYILRMMGTVEPVLYGPYNSSQDRDAAYEELLEIHGDENNSFALFSARELSEIEFNK